MMDSQTYRFLSEFDANLRVGDVVEARFTNSGIAYRFRAKITKLNARTARVQSLEPNKPYERDEPNREFIINRFSNWKLFTENNGIFPISIILE